MGLNGTIPGRLHTVVQFDGTKWYTIPGRLHTVVQFDGTKWYYTWWTTHCSKV